MKKEDINCPPYAPVLMESTRAIGYSIESAVADIIDNSIAAKARTVKIFFDYYPKPYIAICDDGNGMNSEMLTEAMRYGSVSPSASRSDYDLGRYGLGLKTASLSQCRSLTVVSKIDACYEGRRWDLDYINNTKKWSLEQLTESEIAEVYEIEYLQSVNSGTLVLWTELDKIKSGGLTIEKALEEKMIDVKEHLELVFHRFLSGDGIRKVQMFINGVLLEPFDPFLATKSTVLMDDEKIEIPGRKGKVIIKPYVLPHPSNLTKSELEKLGGKDGLRNLQGFYIYRNKRLIIWGSWFKLIRMDEFSKLARVRVDIPNSLDDLWTLDIKKSTAYPPEIVKTRLKQLVSSMSSGSKRTWSFRQRKEIQDNIVHIWDIADTREGKKYIINLKHPILENLAAKLTPDSQDLLKQFLQTVQNSLPFNNLHYDLLSDIKILQDNESDECERVKLFAKEIIKQAISEENLERTMQEFENTEPFMFYLDEIRKVCSEVKRNG